jgi:hypothetical protein
MSFFQYGNKAALIVGIVLLVADSYIPAAQEFGAWPVGCVFCVWYSASAVKEDERLGKKLKNWLYAYLAVVFVIAISLHDSADSPPHGAPWSSHSSLKAVGVESR